jgi:hypothetical protein
MLLETCATIRNSRIRNHGIFESSVVVTRSVRRLVYPAPTIPLNHNPAAHDR